MTTGARSGGARHLVDRDQLAPICHHEGVPVVLDGAICLDLAHAAMQVLQPEMDKLRQRIRDLEGGQPPLVLPAKFITDAMTDIPDQLPSDFS
ncbi:hypothetical protein ACFV8T_00135 [Streptomyces sp. NPDC059832]|uniref:hypothetical protein n=1 Tax=Streptomyces sp. NPDC059832 TaxID=3346966 RepID=UPI00365D6D0A